MSIRLLIDWAQTHELVDDLESFFWVLLYGSLKQFALPDQQLPFDIFNYRRVKPDGCIIGGETKQHSIRFTPNAILPVRFVAEPLRQLIADMRARWRDYDRNLQGLPRLGLTSSYWDEIQVTAQLVVKPSYWAGLIAATIEALDRDEKVVEERAIQNTTVSPAKRKLTPSVGQYDAQHPRRSKRLRTLRTSNL